MLELVGNWQMASHRFDAQSGAATARFQKGHKGMGGRPRTRHLVKMFEDLAAKASDSKAPIWKRTNVAQARWCCRSFKGRCAAV